MLTIMLMILIIAIMAFGLLLGQVYMSLYTGAILTLWLGFSTMEPMVFGIAVLILIVLALRVAGYGASLVLQGETT